MNLVFFRRLQWIASIIPLTGFIMILQDNPDLLRFAGFTAACVLAYLFSFRVVPRWLGLPQ